MSLLSCSFCGKTQLQVIRIIAGPNIRVCDECIGRCNDIIAEQVEQEARSAYPLQATANGMNENKQRLGELLRLAGRVTDVELELALAEQRRTRLRLGETLIRHGFVSELAVAEAVSAQTGIPVVRLGDTRVSAALLQMIPAQACRRFRLIPLKEEGGVLRVAMSDPFDVEAIDFVRTTTSLIPFPSIAPWASILRTLERSERRNQLTPGAAAVVPWPDEPHADSEDVTSPHVAGSSPGK